MNINRVILTGNLTRDPEVRQTASGTTVCKLRVAVNSRVKVQGEWTEKPNYFDVVTFGSQAENVGRYLAKGRALAVDGRLEWSEWEHEGQKRQSVQIIADSIQFLSDGSGNSGGRSTGSDSEPGGPPPVSGEDFGNFGGPAADDDIPF